MHYVLTKKIIYGQCAQIQEEDKQTTFPESYWLWADIFRRETVVQLLISFTPYGGRRHALHPNTINCQLWVIILVRGHIDQRAGLGKNHTARFGEKKIKVAIQSYFLFARLASKPRGNIFVRSSWQPCHLALPSTISTTPRCPSPFKARSIGHVWTSSIV